MRHGVGRSIADIDRLTVRQIGLFYSKAVSQETRQRAERISDVNVAFKGGDPAKRMIDSLLGQI